MDNPPYNYFGQGEPDELVRDVVVRMWVNHLFYDHKYGEHQVRDALGIDRETFYKHLMAP